MEIDIKVRPKARRNGIEVDGDRVTVRVTAAPEKGRANDAVVALMAKQLGIAKGRVKVVRGHKARNKRLCIDGMNAEQVFAQLNTLKIK